MIVYSKLINKKGDGTALEFFSLFQSRLLQLLHLYQGSQFRNSRENWSAWKTPLTFSKQPDQETLSLGAIQSGI